MFFENGCVSSLHGLCDDGLLGYRPSASACMYVYHHENIVLPLWAIMTPSLLLSYAITLASCSVLYVLLLWFSWASLRTLGSLPSVSFVVISWHVHACFEWLLILLSLPWYTTIGLWHLYVDCLSFGLFIHRGTWYYPFCLTLSVLPVYRWVLTCFSHGLILKGCTASTLSFHGSLVNL